MGKRRIALVTPWFGRGLIGGAERLAWDLSHALARAGAEIEILTTCARSFHDDWSANYHRAGTTTVSGLAVRRFRVDPRDRVAFARANGALLGISAAAVPLDEPPLSERLTRAFITENISSRALLSWLQARGRDYDAVLLVPYLYGPILQGLSHVAERAWLVPCLHDESYAYLDAVRALFRSARGLLFNSEGEAEVAAAIYGPWIYAKSTVIGHAVDPVPPPPAPIVVSGFAPHRNRYLLYLGRQDRTKNVDALVDAFDHFRRRRRSTSLQLVLAGPRSGSPRNGDGIVDLGPVNEPVKAALLTYARALVQPSLNESFSRTVYEAWFAQRPVIVHGACRATARAVEDSGGGWIASTPEEWERTFSVVDESADEAVDALGRHGWAAALDNGTWDAVAFRVLDVLAARPPAVTSITQIVPLGESRVARYAAALDASLREACVDVAITIAGASPARPGDAVIVHAVAGKPTSLGDLTIVHDADADPGDGLVLASSLAVLEALGANGRASRLLPSPVDPSRWNGVQAHGNRWRDGHLNILSLAPLESADVETLLEAMVALLERGADPRLLIPLSTLSDHAADTLDAGRRDLDIEAVFVFADDHAAQQYEALRAADVGLAFGRPVSDIASLVMPLWFDIPLLGFDEPLVREVVEPTGLMVETRDPVKIAALLRVVASETSLRAAMRTEGRRVRMRYAGTTVGRTLLEALAAPAHRSKTLERRDSRE